MSKPETQIHTEDRNFIRRYFPDSLYFLTGAVLAAGGFGWWLREALKESADKRTTLAAFVAGLLGIPIINTAILSAYNSEIQEREPQHYSPKKASEGKVTPLAFTMPLVEDPDLFSDPVVRKAETTHFNKTADILSSLAAHFEVKANRCASCQSVYSQLHSMMLQIEADTGSGQNLRMVSLDDILGALKGCTKERAYPDVARHYSRAVSLCSRSFQTEVSSELERFKCRAEQLILKKEFRISKRDILCLFDKHISKYCLPSDLSDEFRKQLLQTLNDYVVCLEKVFRSDVGEFLSSIRKILEPAVVCQRGHNIGGILLHMLHRAKFE